MAEPQLPMVMRSVYLPVGMDENLRQLAFQLRLTKADLIRAFVEDGMKQVVDRLGPNPKEATVQTMVHKLTSGQLPEAEQARSQVAVDGLRRAAAAATAAEGRRPLTR